MISPTELTAYIAELRAAGISGPVEVHGVKLVIPPPAVDAATQPRKDMKAEYDRMLFAATEGIPEEESS